VRSSSIGELLSVSVKVGFRAFIQVELAIFTYLAWSELRTKELREHANIFEALNFGALCAGLYSADADTGKH